MSIQIVLGIIDHALTVLASMLRENPQKRPNVYEVVREVCLMRKKEIPIKDVSSP